MLRLSHPARRPMVPVLLLFCAAMACAASSREADSGQNAPYLQTGPVSYDIPAQPLATALDAYALASGVQVLYETASVEGRRSSEIKGQFDPVIALQKILNGSGLAVRRTDVDAFIIIAVPAYQSGTWVPAKASDTRLMGAVQNRILDALCRDAITRPGDYRIALELWIGPNGIIQSSALIGSTGADFRDQALLTTLRGLPVGVTPPAQLPQPLVLAIVPRGPGGADDCSGR